MIDYEQSLPDSEDIAVDCEDPNELIEYNGYSESEVLYEFEVASSHSSQSKTVHTFI